MDQYYSRLHQQTDWEEKLLGEDAGRRLSANSAVSLTTVSLPQPTKEGDRGETEEGNTAQIAESQAPAVSQSLPLSQVVLTVTPLAPLQVPVRLTVPLCFAIGVTPSPFLCLGSRPPVRTDAKSA